MPFDFLDYIKLKLSHDPSGKKGIYQDRLTRLPGIDATPDKSRYGISYDPSWNKQIILNAMLGLNSPNVPLNQRDAMMIAPAEDKATYNHELIHGLTNRILGGMQQNEQSDFLRFLTNSPSPRVKERLDRDYGPMDEYHTGQEVIANSAEYGDDPLFAKIDTILKQKRMDAVANQMMKVYKRTPKK